MSRLTVSDVLNLYSWVVVFMRVTWKKEIRESQDEIEEHDLEFKFFFWGGTATREMGDGWRYREAGDRLATLRETGDSAKIGLSPNGRWEIYPKSSHLPVNLKMLGFAWGILLWIIEHYVTGNGKIKRTLQFPFEKWVHERRLANTSFSWKI